MKIDKQAFQDRLAHFISAWKADKRSGDALFGGAGSIVILMGKTEEATSFQKNNAMHVRGSRNDADSNSQQDTDMGRLKFWLLGYEFPATLFVLTTEALYIVTTAKKGIAPMFGKDPFSIVFVLTWYAQLNISSPSKAARFRSRSLSGARMRIRTRNTGKSVWMLSKEQGYVTIMTRAAPLCSYEDRKKLESLRRTHLQALSQTSGKKHLEISRKRWRK